MTEEFTVCVRACVCVSITALACRLSLHWQAACESVNGEVFHTFQTDASSQGHSTVLSPLCDRWCLLHQSDGLNIDTFIQIQSRALSIDVFWSYHPHKQTHTDTHTPSHCVDATQYRGLSSRTCPFTSCSHQTWHEAAGFFVPQKRNAPWIKYHVCYF